MKVLGASSGSNSGLCLLVELVCWVRTHSRAHVSGIYVGPGSCVLRQRRAAEKGMGLEVWVCRQHRSSDWTGTLGTLADAGLARSLNRWEGGIEESSEFHPALQAAWEGLSQGWSFPCCLPYSCHILHMQHNSSKVQNWLSYVTLQANWGTTDMWFSSSL